MYPISKGVTSMIYNFHPAFDISEYENFLLEGKETNQLDLTFINSYLKSIKEIVIEKYETHPNNSIIQRDLYWGLVNVLAKKHPNSPENSWLLAYYSQLAHTEFISLVKPHYSSSEVLPDFFTFYKLLLEPVKDYLPEVLPKQFSIGVIEESIKSIKANDNKVLWSKQLPVYIKGFESLGAVLKLPSAYLFEHGLLPKDVILCDDDEDKSEVSLDHLKIKHMEVLNNISHKKNKTKTICKYFAPILGQYKNCRKNPCDYQCDDKLYYENTSEGSYNKEFYSLLIEINNLISLVQESNPSKDDLLNQVISHPIIAKFVYIINLYLLYKYDSSASFYSVCKKDLNTISYDNISNDKHRIGFNFNKLFSLLFTKTPTTTNEDLSDNTAFSSIVAPKSGRGVIFDELFTLLCLNMNIQPSDLLPLSTIWISRICSDISEKDILSNTNLEDLISAYEKTWMVQNICIHMTRLYINNTLPSSMKQNQSFQYPHPFYFIGNIFTLHSNKHAHAFNQIKNTVFTMVKNKGVINEIKFLSEVKDTLINSSTEAFFVFKDALKKSQLTKIPYINELLKKKTSKDLNPRIEKVPFIARFILQKETYTTEDLICIDECIQLVPLFIPKYPPDFEFTDSDLFELLYNLCISSYIIYHYIYDNTSSLGFSISKKGLQKNDTAKPLSKIKTVYDIYTGTKKKIFYTILQYSQQDISDQSNFKLTDTLFLQNFFNPFVDDSTYELLSNPQISDSELHRTLFVYYLILLHAPLYKAINKNIPNLHLDRNYLLETSEVMKELNTYGLLDSLSFHLKIYSITSRDDLVKFGSELIENPQTIKFV